MRRPTSFAWMMLTAVAACAEPAPGDGPSAAIDRVSSPILNGRPSGDDENAAVYIETGGVDAQGQPSAPLRCSGRIIAPGLVVTARHCLLKRRTVNVRCNPDGSPIDIAESTDVEVEPPSAVTVFIGSQKPNLRPVAVKEIFTELEISVCKSDIAYVALAEVGLDTRTPLRRNAPRISEIVSVTGWGYTSDDRTALPDTRSTIERPITEKGPGVIPPDAFSIAGNSTCLGDSGASALAAEGGALVGVYSRIENPDQCSLELTRNIFVSASAHVDLAKRAFAAIGETPWFEGEPKPWLAKAGAPCAKDDECSTAVCDASTSTCGTACGPTGFACPAGKTCSAESTCVDPPAPVELAPPASGDDGGCATSGAKASPASTLSVFALAVLTALASRRRRQRVRH